MRLDAKFVLLIFCIYELDHQFIKSADPVRSCNIYKTIGCSHVDGFLCDFPNCNILKEDES